MARLHFVHSGVVDEGAFVYSFGGELFFMSFFELIVDGFLSFFEDESLLFFEIFETEDVNFEGSFVGFLENEILDGGVIGL